MDIQRNAGRIYAEGRKIPHQGTCPADRGAAFDTPYCAGESGLFEITKDNLTKVGEVKCTLQNIKVTLKYSDALKAQLGESFRATVSVGQERLEYTRDETRSGFFHGQAGENTVDVVLSGEIEGAEIEPIHKSYSGLALGTELVLTLNWQGVNGDPGTEAASALRTTALR